MFKELMHALIKPGPLQNAAQNMAAVSISNSTLTSAGLQNSILRQEPRRYSASKKIFNGNIEVNQVANGYVINIATREGYEYETHIASTIAEVNEIIAAAMVAFQLEK